MVSLAETLFYVPSSYRAIRSSIFASPEPRCGRAKVLPGFLSGDSVAVRYAFLHAPWNEDIELDLLQERR